MIRFLKNNILGLLDFCHLISNILIILKILRHAICLNLNAEYKSTLTPRLYYDQKSWSALISGISDLTHNHWNHKDIPLFHNFTLALNELREKDQRAFYAIKRWIKIDIPIQIWLKPFKPVIEPIVLYGSDVNIQL